MAQEHPSSEQRPWCPTRRQINWILGGAIISAAIIYLIILGFWIPWTRLDQQERDFLHQDKAKDLWDWLGLLIVPAVIAAVGLWFNHTQKQTELKTSREHREQDRDLARQEREQDRKIADERRQQEQEIAVFLTGGFDCANVSEHLRASEI